MIDLMNIENVSLKVDGLRIAGQLYLPNKGQPHRAVAICHGLPARVPQPGERGYADLAERVCGAGLAAFIFNFRGTGSSGGNLDMRGWPRDLTAVIDYLTGRTELENLSLLGFSAGAAVSVFVVAQDERVSAVAACACPADFHIINEDNAGEAIEHYRGLGVIRDADFPPSVGEWLAGFEQVRAIDYVARISPRPLLLVHGTADDVVDISHARRLYERAKEPKRLMLIDGAGHRLRHDEKMVTKVIAWLKGL
jgi:fermentation-respiration switch protein FrsA (DUF1100 family)